jgi:hypothetical protein
MRPLVFQFWRFGWTRAGDRSYRIKFANGETWVRTVFGLWFMSKKGDWY